MPDFKEPHFFGTDLFSPLYIRDEAKYLSLFATARKEKRVGEASVWYLYSTRAAMEIKEFNRDARIIIMLRNPTEMIYSLHSQRLFTGNEDIEDFEAALDAEEDRNRGARLPKHSYPVEALYYRQVGRYNAQVLRYFEAFGRDQVHVIIFEDFVRDVPEVYKTTCAFLGVTDQFTPAFGVTNANKRVRIKPLRDFLRHPPPVFSKPAKLILPLPVRRFTARALTALNTRYEPRRPMPSELRRRVQLAFAPDVAQLSGTLGRDLSAWLI